MEPKRSLNDLKREGLLKLPSGFGGTNIDDMESGWNNIFLNGTEIGSHGKALKLLCKTKRGSEVSASIRSEDKRLLLKIEGILGSLIGDPISNLYYKKVF
ncbi:MAG TPA: hypothetical protein VIH52_02090 [Candidatus Nanoarchaeia archaeon]